MKFRLLEPVRVARLSGGRLVAPGTRGVSRPPRVGDEGAVVLTKGDRYTVECTTERGETIWVADFREDELCSTMHDM